MEKQFYKKGLIFILAIFFSVMFSLYLNPESNNRALVFFIFTIPFIIFFINIVEELSNKFKKISLKKRVTILIFSAIICILYFLMFLSYANYVLIFNGYINKIIKISIVIVCYLSIVFLFVSLLDVKIEKNKIHISKSRIIIYALPCIIFWLFYLIAFYPGVMTADSMNQWDQMISGVYRDSNPVVHTLLNYLITRLWHSPAAVALTQIIFLAIIVGYCMYRFEGIGVNRSILYIVTGTFAINPVNGIMVITLWKDVVYSGFILLFTMLIINILVSEGDWINRKSNFIFFIFCCLGVILFRHNGIVPLFGTLLFLMVSKLKNSKFYLKSLIYVIAIFILIKGPVYKIMKVQYASSSEAFGIPTQQIAAVINEQGYLTEKQLKKAEEIMPLKSWEDNYMPGNVDYIKFHQDFNVNKLMEDKKGFINLWIGACIQNPKIALRAYGSQTAIAWSVKGYTNYGSRTIIKNDFGLKQKVINVKINKIANKVLNITQQIEDIRLWLWRPAFQLFFIILAGFMCIIRNGKRYGLVICPTLFNTLTILLATPAQDFRYLYANTLVCFVVILFSFIEN